MPDWERKTIAGHVSRENASLPLGCAFFFSLVGGLLGMAGLIFVLSGLDALPGGVWHVPPAVGVCAAVALLAIGTAMAVFPMRSSIRGRRERERAQHMLEERPREPWLADHDWDPAEARNDERNAHFILLFAAFFLFFFLTPFNWFAFFADDGRWFHLLVVVPFDLALLLLLFGGLSNWIRFLRYGDLRLRIERFPYFLGDSFAATLVVPRLPPEVSAVGFTIRCIEERPARVPDPRRAGHGGGGGPRIFCDQVYADACENGNLQRDAWNGAEVRVSFLLPTGDLSTRLRDEHPRYWELEAKAAAPGARLKAVFLIPVYQRPGGA